MARARRLAAIVTASLLSLASAAIALGADPSGPFPR